MQIPMSILIIGALQLALLIAAVYMTAFWRARYTAHFTAADVLLLALQVFNLIFLSQCMTGYNGIQSTANDYSALLILTQSGFMLLLLLRFAWRLRGARARRRELLTPQSIRETIDYLPGGICFSTPGGRPVLTNHRMNQLIFQLTGHTIMNAKTTWEELLRLNSGNGCVKLDKPWMIKDHMGEEADDDMFFSLPGGSIWRFRKEALTDGLPHYVQLEATDISDLYRYSKELYENNQRLAEQYERQQKLLANIVEINHEKEVLQAKMRIHDDLGRSILTTKQHLWNQTLSENIPYLAGIWNNTIRSLTDFTQIDADAEISPEIELRRAAEMIGCRIDFHGERPVHRKIALLFYATVREALTNAVMHANADRLNVTINPTGRGYHVEISDNGTVTVSDLTEGSGLSNLRKRLEREGATLEVKCGDGVALIAEFPAEGKEASPQEVRKEW